MGVREQVLGTWKGALGRRQTEGGVLITGWGPLITGGGGTEKSRMCW